MIVLLRLAGHVYLSIEFYRKPLHRTVEIKDVKLNTVLTAKLASIEL